MPEIPMVSVLMTAYNREKYISEATLKTIAAFLNTKGGDLLIGVDDNSMITGIDNELYKLHKGNKDKFLNTFIAVVATAAAS